MRTRQAVNTAVELVLFLFSCRNTLAVEFKDRNIAVNALAPGFVNTEIHAATLAAGPDKAGQEFFEMTKRKAADGAVPMEVPVACVRYLLSAAADGLTGKTLSASFDPWGTPAFDANIDALNQSDLYTMQRINFPHLPDDPLVPILESAKNGMKR